MPKKLGAALIAAIVLGFAVQQLIYSFQLGDNTSPVADSFSENNAIQAASYYGINGFTSNVGLPTFRVNSPAYTHYPPGPDWATGVAMLLFGEHNTPYFRIFPILVFVFCGLALGYALLSSSSPEKATLLFCALAVLPMFTNMMHGLHYQGYSLAILLLQLGYFYTLFASDRPIRLREPIILFGIGFIQGWLSFDYFFLVALAGIPILLLTLKSFTWREFRRHLLTLIWPGLGFVVAHVLHFIQVWIYFGSLRATVVDYLQTGVARVQGLGGPNDPPPPWLKSSFGVVWQYLTQEVPKRSYYGPGLTRVVWGLFCFLAIGAAIAWLRGEVKARWCEYELGIHFKPQLFFGALAALFVASGWPAVMRGHSQIHVWFLPRHYFIFYFTTVLAFLSAFRVSSRSFPAVPIHGPEGHQSHVGQ